MPDQPGDRVALPGRAERQLLLGQPAGDVVHHPADPAERVGQQITDGHPHSSLPHSVRGPGYRRPCSGQQAARPGQPGPVPGHPGPRVAGLGQLGQPGIDVAHGEAARGERRRRLDLVPVQRGRDRRARPGPDRVRRDRGLRVGVAHDVRVDVAVAGVLALLDGDQLRLGRDQPLGHLVGELAHGVEILLGVQRDLDVQPLAAGGLHVRGQSEVVFEDVAQPQRHRRGSAAKWSSSGGSRSKISWSGWCSAPTRLRNGCSSMQAWLAR